MKAPRSPQELGAKRLAPQPRPGQLAGYVEPDIFQQHAQHPAPLELVDEKPTVAHLELAVAEPAQAFPGFLRDPGPAVPVDGKARQDKTKGSLAGHDQALRRERRSPTTASSEDAALRQLERDSSDDC